MWTTHPMAEVIDMADMSDIHFFTLPNFAKTLAISADGSQLLTAGFGKKVSLWNTDNGKLVREFVPGHDRGSVEGLAFSPDGHFIVAGSSDGVEYLWNAQTGAEVLRFIGHTNLVFRADFSKDGRYLLTASQDHTARLWDTSTGKALRVFAGHTGPVNGADFFPDGKTVVTASSDGAIRVWNVDIQNTITDLCAKLIRDLSAAERAQYNIQDSSPTCPKP